MLKGIDVSKFQTATPDLTGLSFITARATIATTVDSMYATHVANARKAGLIVMAYHYGYPLSTTLSIEAQAALFVATAKSADFLWLDQEKSGFDDAQAQTFINAVRAAGYPCGLYHSASGFGGVNADANWVADWRAAAVTAGHPLNAAGTGEFIGWDIWQWQGAPLDSDFAKPGALQKLLRLGLVTRETHIADLAALTSTLAQVSSLTAERDTLKATVATLQSTVTDDQARLTQAASDLATASGIERERIALALGQAEADRVRNT